MANWFSITKTRLVGTYINFYLGWMSFSFDYINANTINNKVPIITNVSAFFIVASSNAVSSNYPSLEVNVSRW